MQGRYVTIGLCSSLLLLSFLGVSLAHHARMHSGNMRAMILALAVDPVRPQVLYTGSFGRGVFKTTDGGKLWSAINDGLENLYVRTLIIDPAQPATLYAGTDEGLFKSTNGGQQWVAMHNGLGKASIRCLLLDPAASTTIYVGTGDGVWQDR